MGAQQTQLINVKNAMIVNNVVIVINVINAVIVCTKI